MGQSLFRDDAAQPNEKDCEAASDGKSVLVSSSPRRLQDEINELNDQQKKDWKRWEGKEHDIIPHTDAAGDQYCIGDAYEGIKSAPEWKVNEYVLGNFQPNPS